jgi:hypothetical protein
MDIDWYNEAVVIYFGSEACDESVYRILNEYPVECSATICVGDHRTSARYKLANSKEAAECFELINITVSIMRKRHFERIDEIIRIMSIE